MKVRLQPPEQPSNRFTHSRSSSRVLHAAFLVSLQNLDFKSMYCDVLYCRISCMQCLTSWFGLGTELNELPSWQQANSTLVSLEKKRTFSEDSSNKLHSYSLFRSKLVSELFWKTINKMSISLTTLICTFPAVLGPKTCNIFGCFLVCLVFDPSREGCHVVFLT